MIHIHYDFSLIVGSIILAILICYLAISIEQLLFSEQFKKYKKTILVIRGYVIGAAI
jgi:NO-binding membrane sensor protein with MHYT domain